MQRKEVSIVFFNALTQVEQTGCHDDVTNPLFYGGNPLNVVHLSIFCPPGGAAGIHGALDRRPFLTGGTLINLWNSGPG